MSNRYQLGWFSTGRDKAARDLLKTVQDNIELGTINARIAFVFSNREPGESAESDLFFEMVKDYHISLVCLSSEKFRTGTRVTNDSQPGAVPTWRLEYDRAIMEKLGGFHPDLCVLAGYMLIVGPEMCQKYNMINLHPAAPGGPTGTWQEVIWQLIENDAGETGVMIHLVTPELDKGPPVTYCTYSIRGGPFNRHWTDIKGLSLSEVKKQQGENSPLFQLIRQHGLAREFPVIVATVRAFSEGKIKISPEKQVIDWEGRPIKGYNLTDEINELVREVI